MNSFDTVEIMYELGKAIRHSVIAVDSLSELNGVDRSRVSAYPNPFVSLTRKPLPTWSPS